MARRSLLADFTLSTPQFLRAYICMCRVLGAEVAPMARRSLLVDFITVYGLGGKAIVFTETKREADEVAAALANTHPCEVRRLSVFCWLPPALVSYLCIGKVAAVEVGRDV